MNSTEKEIFQSTIVRTILKKIFDTDDIDSFMPISTETIHEKFLELAKAQGSNFETIDIKNLYHETFFFGFVYALRFDNPSEREIEELFIVIRKALDIPHLLTAKAFFWFRHGIKLASEEKPKLSIIFNLRKNLCEKFGIENPAPLPTQEKLDLLFKKVDKSIFDEINIESGIIENSLSQIAFQYGYLAALNMGVELDDELLNITFNEIFEETFNETERSNDEILAYFLVFREGYKACKK